MRRYLRADSAESLVEGGLQESLLDPYKPYLQQRLAAGVRTISVLHREITARGYQGSYPTVSRYVKPLRAARRQRLAAAAKRPRPPTVRQVAGWITGLPGRLDADETARLAAIRARCPSIDAIVRYVNGFARMIKDLSGDEEHLTAWMRALDRDLPVMRAFTSGIRRDMDAVIAGLTLPYSSGPVEGIVRKIKVLEAQMYGRAGPDLIRARLLGLAIDHTM